MKKIHLYRRIVLEGCDETIGLCVLVKYSSKNEYAIEDTRYEPAKRTQIH